jgi:hypothetical protein
MLVKLVLAIACKKERRLGVMRLGRYLIRAPARLPFGGL